MKHRPTKSELTDAMSNWIKMMRWMASKKPDSQTIRRMYIIETSRAVPRPQVVLKLEAKFKKAALEDLRGL
jgi:hypothetical protein